MLLSLLLLFVIIFFYYKERTKALLVVSLFIVMYNFFLACCFYDNTVIADWLGKQSLTEVQTINFEAPQFYYYGIINKITTIVFVIFVSMVLFLF